MNLTATFIRNVAFPAMERLKNNRIRENISEMVANEQKSVPSLHQLRQDKLKALLAHAVNNVPAYRSYGSLLPLIEQDPSAALNQFPILTKQVFRRDRDAYLADNACHDALILNRSGGSTGEPVTFYMNRHSVEYSEAARWRGLSWWGIRRGDPSVMIWGSPIELSQQQMRKHRLYERLLKNRIVIPAFDLNADKVRGYVRRMESFKPMYLYIWPSTLELFVRLMQEQGIQPKLRLKAIVSTAEVIHPYQRQLFESFFSCPVVNEYGAREGGILGYECPNGNMHATVDNSWMEVVHPETMEPVPEGQPGLLLVTDLHNYVMPRLRYQLGDVVALSSERCACGRQLPILGKLDGREDDTFVATNGRYVNGQYFTNVARTLPSIAQFQIIQTAPSQITLKLLEHNQLQDDDIEAFKDAIRKQMGHVDLTVEKVSEIPPVASGKFRAAIRTFPLHQSQN